MALGCLRAYIFITLAESQVLMLCTTDSELSGYKGLQMKTVIANRVEEKTKGRLFDSSGFSDNQAIT